MRNQTFWSIGVAAFALAAACGGKVDDAPAPGASASAAGSPTSSGGSGKRPPQPPLPGEDEEMPGPLECPRTGIVTETDVQQAFDGPWKGPGIPPAACSQADLDALKTLFKSSSNVQFKQIKDALGATCATCAFTASSAATWGPFVDFADGTYVNYGACYATIAGDACGRNVSYFDVCTNALCDEAECGSQQAVASCSRTVATAGGGCATFTAGIQTSCGSLDAVDAACGSVFQLLATVCGGGQLDAGSP